MTRRPLMASLLFSLFLLPAPAFGTALPDTAALQFRGFRAGARLDELDALMRRQGGRLRCDRAKRDPKVSECRGRVSDSIAACIDSYGLSCHYWLDTAVKPCPGVGIMGQLPQVLGQPDRVAVAGDGKYILA